MKELFLKFREISYFFKDALSPSSDANSLNRYAFDLLLAYNQQELFSDSPKNKYEPISIDSRLMNRRSPEDPRPLLLDCLSKEIRDAVTEAQEPTRLRIVSGVPAIDAMSWEALDGTGRGGGAVGVTRLVPVLLPPPPLSVTLPIRILVVATNPKDERFLDSEREIDAITSSIDRQKYVVQILSPATREEAIDTIKSFQPHVFHYVGHSGVVRGAGAIVLHEPSLGTTDWMGAADIAQMLPISTRLVCLSTCFTQQNYNVRGLSLLAHAPQSVGLPTCIANRAEVMESDVSPFGPSSILRWSRILETWRTRSSQLKLHRTFRFLPAAASRSSFATEARSLLGLRRPSTRHVSPKRSRLSLLRVSQRN